jgi:hypothetical protein
MSNIQTHVCLVYNTATSNIVPVLDPALRPQRVVLVHGADYVQQAEDIAAVLQPAGVKVQYWLLDDMWDIEYIRERLLELVSEYEDKGVMLNASGGTRLMSMAATEIFREFQLPIFYIHPKTDNLHWLHDRKLPMIACADRIKLPAFLRAHGVHSGTNNGQAIPQNLRDLTAELVQVVGRIERPLAALNWLANKADNKYLKSPRLDENQRRWHELQALITRFEQAGVLEYRDDCLVFSNEAMRFYTNGGWLEEHVFGLLYGLRSALPQIQDIGRGVEIIRKQSGREVKNEVDVVFLANNHLYLIECKTKRFSQQPSADSPGAEVLYKLDTLEHLFGDVRIHTLLVSYQTISDWDKRRAKDLGIETCTSEQLPQLGGQLRRWIEKAKKM